MSKRLLIGLTILFFLTPAIILFRPSSLGKADKPVSKYVENEQIESSRPQPIKNNLLTLKSKLEREIDSYQGEVALSLTDLDSGVQISIDGDVSYYPASTIKFLVLVGVLKDVENDKYTLSSVNKLITDMMNISSNTAANKLINKIGFTNLTKLPDEIGMGHTVFIHGFSPSVMEIPRFRGGANSITANDANLFWQRLFTGRFLGSLMTKKALEYSKLPNVNLIYSSKGASLYHKPGFLKVAGGETYIDSGIVESDKFTYVVSYFSRNNFTHKEGADFGLKLTKIIYEWFSENYQ